MTQPLRSIRAKLIESVREYCAEHFLRPYIWVDVDDACLVPFEYVTEGMIILDVDDEAVRGLELMSSSPLKLDLVIQSSRCRWSFRLIELCMRPRRKRRKKVLPSW